MHTTEHIAKIQKTASTLFDLIEHSDIAYGDAIAAGMIAKTGMEWPRISVSDFSAFPVARFHTNHGLLEYFAKKYETRLQVIELGSGFTPHYYNISSKIGKYIEVEFAINSQLKKEICTEIRQSDNQLFLSGDILEKETWARIKEELNPHDPVLIFSEGVVSQYFSDEQKIQLASFVNEVLVTENSCIIFDDTLRNHPEMHTHPIIEEGMKKIVIKSGSDTYNHAFQTFAQEVARWKTLLNDTEIVSVNYVLSKPTMDFAIKEFKLMICLKNPDETTLQELHQISDINKHKRIWK